MWFDVVEKFFDYVIMPIFILFLIGFVLVIVALPLALMSGWKPQSQVAYEECMADGQKEYECYAMIYGGARRVK